MCQDFSSLSRPLSCLEWWCSVSTSYGNGCPHCKERSLSPRPETLGTLTATWASLDIFDVKVVYDTLRGAQVMIPHQDVIFCIISLPSKAFYLSYMVWFGSNGVPQGSSQADRGCSARPHTSPRTAFSSLLFKLRHTIRGLVMRLSKWTLLLLFTVLVHIFARYSERSFFSLPSWRALLHTPSLPSSERSCRLQGQFHHYAINNQL